LKNNPFNLVVWFHIGCLHLYPTPDRVIINFPTKKHWRDPSRVDYIEAGLVEFVRIYEQHGLSSVAFPQLGCGQGGLNWERQVRPVMEKYLQALSLPVYIHLVTPGRAS
jgi:O-acetyl-ADP-ribose deacetylase (regulator of RNase III)